MRSRIAWKISSLLEKCQYIAPLVTPAAVATSSTEVLEKPRSANKSRQRVSSASRVRALRCAFFDPGFETAVRRPAGSGVEARAPGDLVNQLLLLAQREADHVHAGRRMLPHRGAIGLVVSGAKHVL